MRVFLEWFCNFFWYIGFGLPYVYCAKRKTRLGYLLDEANECFTAQSTFVAYLRFEFFNFQVSLLINHTLVAKKHFYWNEHNKEELKMCRHTVGDIYAQANVAYVTVI